MEQILQFIQRTQQMLHSLPPVTKENLFSLDHFLVSVYIHGYYHFSAIITNI